MNDFEFVQFIQPPTNLVENGPDLLFLESLLLFPFDVYLSKNVPVVCVLHYDVKAVGFEKGLFVRDDVGMVDRGEDSHLVQ